jgi:predicted  nucleic acid-binding Zn-ribbon protein
MAEINEARRRQMVADTAYFLAERRGFEGGDPAADWLEAEAEVDARLREGHRESWLGNLDERLAEANERFEALMTRLGGLTGEARDEWAEDLEQLKKLRRKLRKRIKDLHDQGEHLSEKARHQAKKVSDEIFEAIERARARLRS